MQEYQHAHNKPAYKRGTEKRGWGWVGAGFKLGIVHVRSQVQACDFNEIVSLLGCHAAFVGNSLPAFRYNL